MKTISKILILSLSLSFCFSLFGCIPKKDDKVTINGIIYNFDKSDEYYYVDSVEDKNLTEAIIEDYINGFPVQDIGANVARDSRPFKNCKNLKSVFIPETVKYIGYEAFFNCESLTNITIPDSVEIIDSCAFYWCKNLTTISFPKNLKRIGSEAFYDCESLTEVNLHNGVTSIWRKAFMDCTSLQSINLPDTITEIERMAFWDCDSLTELKLPKSLKYISYYMAFSCDRLSKIYIPKSITSIDELAFSGCIIYYEGTITDWEKISIHESLNFYTDYINFNSY